jgi:hypothetical protein
MRKWFISLIALLAVTQVQAAKPNIWFTQADIDSLYHECQMYPDAIGDLAGLRGAALGWENKSNSFYTKYPGIIWNTRSTYPPRPEAWGDTYGDDYSSIGYGLNSLGLYYSLTESTQFATAAKEILLGFAATYASFPQEQHLNYTSDQSKIFVQRLDEAMWGIDMAFGYSCIKSTLTPTERTQIETDLLKPIHACVFKFSGNGANNYTCVWDECAAAVGYATNDAAIIDDAINGYRASDGYKYLVDNWISADGSVLEATMGYHLMGMRGLIGIAEAARVAGTDLYTHNSSRIKLAMNFIVNFVFPDNVSPATHDGGNTNILKDYMGSCIYDNMYLRFKDPLYKTLLVSSWTKLQSMEGRPEPSRFYEPISANDLPERRSLTFDHVGFGILRSKTGADQSYVLLDYGPFGFHGHLDKLNIVTYFAGSQMALDPGTFAYSDARHTSWSVASVAHNTVVVDLTSQAQKAGTFNYFDTTYAACQVMSGSADSVSTGVGQTRYIALTPNYMVDVYTLASTSNHYYDWMYHNAGSLVQENGIAAASGMLSANNGYQHITKKYQGVVANDIQATFKYQSTNLDLKILGVPGTDLIVAEGLGPEVAPTIPMLVLRRSGAANRNTKYIVLHNPYTTTTSPSVATFRKTAETADALGLRMDGVNFNDYFVLTTGAATAKTVSDTLDANEFFTYSGRFCYARNKFDTLKVYGTVPNFRKQQSGATVVCLNDAVVPVTAVGSYWEYPAYTGGTGAIQGRVTDADLAALGVPHTKIELLNGPAYYLAYTDSIGNYSFPMVKSGTYTLSAIHAGYVTQTIPGTAGNTTVNVSLQIDAAAPAITSVQAVYANGQAVITWTTSQPATSQVQYGPTTGYGTATTATTQYVFTHRVVLTGLTSGATYYYKVVSVDFDAHSGELAGPASFDAVSLFSDNFEANNLAKWAAVSSANWEVISDAGDLSAHQKATAGEIMLIDQNYGTFSFDCDIKGEGTSTYRNAGIIFGYQDSTHFLFAEFCGSSTTGYNGIKRKSGTTLTKIAGNGSAATLTDVTTYHHIRVTRDLAAREIKCYFDDSSAPIFTSTFDSLKNGKVGLWANAKTAFFDNVEVVPYIRTDPFLVGIRTATAPAAPYRTSVVLQNPARSSVTIAYTLTAAATPVFKVFRTTGELMLAQDLGSQAVGRHEHVWKVGADLASGCYLYTIEGAGFSQSGRLLLVK